MSDVSHLIQQIRNIASAYPEGLGTDAQAALNHSANEVELHIAELEAALQRIADFGHADNCDSLSVPVYTCCCYKDSQWDIARLALAPPQE